MKLFAESFLVAYAIERIAETFWKRRKIAGQIVCSYSLPILVSVYMIFYLMVLTSASGEDGAISPIGLSTGIALVFVSMIGRNWSIRSLGVFHSIHIEIRERHVWVEAGPYRFVRNPYYLSSLIEAIGLALIPNSRRPLTILCLLYLPALMHRLIAEESAHRTKFQATFKAYCMRVPALVPKCLYDLGGRLLASKGSGRYFSHE